MLSITRSRIVMLSAAVSLSAPASAAFTGYIKFDGVDGESVDLPFRGWSELTSVQIDVGFAPPDDGSVRGGEPTFAMSFAMPADISYPELAVATLQGEVFPAVNVAQVSDQHGGVVFEHELQAATLDSVRLTATAAGQLVVGEIATTDFYQTTYNQYDANGVITDSSTTAYDFMGGVSAATARLPGDYNGDGYIDESDYGVWTEQFGVTMVTLGGGADGNADGRVDAADFTVWRDNYLSGQGGAVAVPEPAAAALAGALALAACRLRL